MEGWTGVEMPTGLAIMAHGDAGDIGEANVWESSDWDSIEGGNVEIERWLGGDVDCILLIKVELLHVVGMLL